MIELCDSSADGVSPDQVREIVEATRPLEVRVDEVHAGPVGAIRPLEFEAELIPGVPGFALLDEGNELAVRIEHSLRCANIAEEAGDDESDDPDEATTITVAHVVRFECTGHARVSPDVISAFIETNVYFIAYPYVRQFFASITADMGLPSVVLGYMHRDERPYSNAALLAPQSD